MVLLLRGTFCTDAPETSESIKRIADYQKHLIGADVFNSMMEKSGHNVESDSSQSSSDSTAYDSCNSNGFIDDDDDDDDDSESLEMIKNCAFRRATIVYLMKILKELEKLVTEVTVPFNRLKFLKFLDNSINLIDLFENVFSHRKDDTAIILKRELNEIISNFDFIDEMLPEVKNILTEEYEVYGKQCELKKFLKKILALTKYYNELKKEFKEYNGVEKQYVIFDLTRNIEALNEYKKKLNDKKIIIYNMNDEDVEKEVDDFSKGLLEVYKNFYEILESELNFLTVDFNNLNYFWNSTSQCIDNLVSYVKSFDLTKKALTILNKTCAGMEASEIFQPEEKK
jgi:hypothetical protein